MMLHRSRPRSARAASLLAQLQPVRHARAFSSALPEVQRRDGTTGPINKARGFIEYERNPEPYRPPATRLLDYGEINAKHEPLELKRQAARCMDLSLIHI